MWSCQANQTEKKYAFLTIWADKHDKQNKEKDRGLNAYLPKGPGAFSLKIHHLGMLCSTESED